MKCMLPLNSYAEKLITLVLNWKNAISIKTIWETEINFDARKKTK